jgi:hypothetical protein
VAHRRSSGYLRLSEVGNHTAFSVQTGRSPLQLRNIAQNGKETSPLAPPFNTVASLAEERLRQKTVPLTNLPMIPTNLGNRSSNRSSPRTGSSSSDRRAVQEKRQGFAQRCITAFSTCSRSNQRFLRRSTTSKRSLRDRSASVANRLESKHQLRVALRPGVHRNQKPARTIVQRSAVGPPRASCRSAGSRSAIATDRAHTAATQPDGH